MLSIRLYTTAALLLMGLVAQGQSPVLSLDSVLQRISLGNPMLREFESRAKAQNAMAEGARSQMAPMVGAGVFMYPYPGQMEMEGQDDAMFMTAVEQEITNPAKLRAREKYQLSKAAIEEAGRDKAFNQLRAQAKTAYYQWVVLEKKKSVLLENQRIMQFMLKLGKVRYPYNQSSLGSIYKAEGRLGEVENMLVMNDSEIIRMNIQLNMLMNLPPETRFRIDTTAQAPKLTVLPDTAYLSAARSDIRQLDRTIESMRLNLRLENMQRKPDFGIRFENMMPRDRMMPQSFTLMGMVSIPIAPWSSKMYKSNIKAMDFEIQGMQKGRESLLNEAQAMVATMAQELQTKQTQVRNYETKIIPALRRNYETTMLSYEQNTSQLPLVIDAWEALNMAQMEYLNNLEQLYLIGVNYEKELEK
ncbi:TolC family protein [Rufibacter quisquiliarum]|uniref:Outer membrane protein TolC n=1 Tax=Rufibacter quisquiliarum TaxID=1549639 RepID=A0A839GQL9_9BACT|nr:TolC family protein [Rufibacter quisquiliarum]MBA9079109.1 outer membrane protein TolC [Rufibacter quisquiliarum]